MPEAHFELILPNGTRKLRKDNTIMQFKPSAYMVLETEDTLIFARDCRTPPMLQFVGGGINIGTETPLDAAVREACEEVGAKILPEDVLFIGQFETYEPVHLFKAKTFTTDSGFVMQEEEVSEIYVIHKDELYDPVLRVRFQKQFYRAQWKMLGWYLLYEYHPDIFPVFKLWSEDPWAIIDKPVSKINVQVPKK